MPMGWAPNGEPGAAVSSPSPPTVKLSISDVDARVPTSLTRSGLTNTAVSRVPSANVTGRDRNERRQQLGASATRECSPSDPPA